MRHLFCYRQLDKRNVLNFLSWQCMLLAGDTSARSTVSRRELVIKKINLSMVSLAQEHFPDTKRQLFGPNFDQRLKTRSRTAGIIWKGLQRGETFFRGGASQGFQRPWNQYRQFRPFQRGQRQSTGFKSPQFQSSWIFKLNQ